MCSFPFCATIAGGLRAWRTFQNNVELGGKNPRPYTCGSKMKNVFFPNFAVASVLELGVDRLRAIGAKALLLDVDCTLKEYQKQEPEPEIIQWLRSLEDSGFRLCLLSNGVGRRISRVATALSLPFVAKACKPFPRGVRKATRLLGVEPNETALVGDQIFADILAGNLAGATTILVKPIKPEQERWFTRIKRPPESIVVKSFWKKCPDGGWSGISQN